MLVLSILIMLALGVAVASFFIAGAQWLLILSAALVLFAFYLSRRAAHSIPDPSREAGPAPLRPVREHLQVTIDDQAPELGRHREDDLTDLDDLDLDSDNDDADDPQPHPENGRAVAS